MERLLLASGSPRRRELLETAGIAFDIVVPDLDESLRDHLPPAERVLALAEDKAREVARGAPESAPRLVLAADTLVCVPDPAAPGGEGALGKPGNEADARRMLKLLSGRTHFVRTGIALLDRASGALLSDRSDTAVSFDRLTEEEIDAYLASREWEGAAGAYRIQGLAAFFAAGIEGSWTGVVGLPMRELYGILKRADFRVPSLRTGQ